MRKHDREFRADQIAISRGSDALLLRLDNRANPKPDQVREFRWSYVPRYGEDVLVVSLRDSAQRLDRQHRIGRMSVNAERLWVFRNPEIECADIFGVNRREGDLLWSAHAIGPWKVTASALDILASAEESTFDTPKEADRKLVLDAVHCALSISRLVRQIDSADLNQ